MSLKAPNDVSTEFKGLSVMEEEICTLEVTVITGLEKIAAEEIKEKLDIEAEIFKGRLFFDVEIKRVCEVFKIRSINNINVIIFMKGTVLCRDDDRMQNFQRLYKLSGLINFRKGIRVWQMHQNKDFGDVLHGEKELTHIMVIPKPEVDLRMLKKTRPVLQNLPEDVLEEIYDSKNENEEKPHLTEDEILQKEKLQPWKNLPQRICSDLKFRASCHRVGVHHNFVSSEAARQFGGGLNCKFGWPVDLSNFDLEVELNILDEFAYVGLCLTKESLSNRNLFHFGRVSLRSTVAYGMLHLMKPKVGDIIVDHMCGGGSIPLEGCFSYKNCFFYGGDLDNICVNRTRANLDHHLLNKASLKADVCQWDVTNLPLTDQSIDVIVSDLPFGYRVGSRWDNGRLYYNSFLELARVVKINTGRAALLTADRKNMITNISRVNSLWRNFACKNINLGGILACIYLFQRTSMLTNESLKPFYFKQKKNYNRLK